MGETLESLITAKNEEEKLLLGSHFREEENRQQDPRATRWEVNELINRWRNVVMDWHGNIVAVRNGTPSHNSLVLWGTQPITGTGNAGQPEPEMKTWTARDAYDDLLSSLQQNNICPLSRHRRIQIRSKQVKNRLQYIPNLLTWIYFVLCNCSNKFNDSDTSLLWFVCLQLITISTVLQGINQNQF